MAQVLTEPLSHVAGGDPNQERQCVEGGGVFALPVALAKLHPPARNPSLLICQMGNSGPRPVMRHMAVGSDEVLHGKCFANSEEY